MISLKFKTSKLTKIMMNMLSKMFIIWFVTAEHFNPICLQVTWRQRDSQIEVGFGLSASQLFQRGQTSITSKYRKIE